MFLGGELISNSLVYEFFQGNLNEYFLFTVIESSLFVMLIGIENDL